MTTDDLSPAELRGIAAAAIELFEAATDTNFNQQTYTDAKDVLFGLIEFHKEAHDGAKD